MKRLSIPTISLTLSAVTLAVGLASGSAPQTASSPAPRTRPPQTAAPTPQVPHPPAVKTATPSSEVKSATSPVATASANDAIRTYCVGCHNDKLKRGELSLAGFDVAKAADHAEIAEKAIRKLRTGMMPPREASRKPDASTRLSLVTALETTIDNAAALGSNPGRRTFQRLNRAEYAAAMRALLGLDIDVSTYLPADTISASFDNIADTQTPSATVMQGYMRAAAHVSRVAVGDPSIDASSTQYAVPRTASQKQRVEGAPFGTRGGTVVVHNFPADGTYDFQLLLHGEPTGFLFGRTQREIQMEVAIDGERVALLKIDRWMSEQDPQGLTISTGPIQVRAGAHQVAATFIQEFEGTEDDLIRPIDHTLADTQIGVGYGVTTLPHLRNLAIVGPHAVTGVSDTPTRRSIFICRPTAPAEAAPCARRILERLAGQAYRRPATAADVNELMPFYERGAQSGGFESGVRMALQAMLSSLHFLFRVEETPATVKPGTPYRISDVDLASRLSFFLWGTIPDAELITAARRAVARRHDGPPGQANAGRQSVGGARHAVRLAVAPSSGPGQGRTRRPVVPLLRRVARRGDGARNRVALRVPGSRGSAGVGTADRRLHLRQRTPGAALRDFGRQRPGVPQGDLPG